MAIKILVGTLLGFLTGLGIGGGSLLMLWLTEVMNISQITAKSINLLYFLPSALTACCYRYRQKMLPVKKLLPAMLSGAAAAAAFSRFGIRMNSHLLKKGFGLLLLAVGFREIMYRDRSQ